VNFRTILGVIAVAILLFFGIVFLFFSIIFAIASSADETASRSTTAILLLVGSIVLFVIGTMLAYLISRKPKTVIQRLEVSGEMKAVAIKCPNCSASVDANRIKMVSGVPYATCNYCGHTFEVAEEPKW
jgi:Zn finger protein HypA/HybF involved in hydrogenase expression